MLNFTSIQRVYLARGTYDMRRGIDALSAVVISELGKDVYNGDCFVFIGRDRKRLKALVWEKSGFWLCFKRLDHGTFEDLMVNHAADQRSMVVSVSQIHALLEGLVVKVLHRRLRGSAIDNV